MATSYTSDKKIGALDPITGTLSSTDELVVNKNGDILKAEMSDVEAFVFASKTQVTPQTGDVMIVRRGTDIRQVVTQDMIPDGAISNQQISNSAAITHSKLASMPAASVMLGNASNVPTATAVTGDVTISNAGSTTIVNSAVTTAKIADANVTTAKIADANVTTEKIADANVTTAKIADANVTTAKITDGAITQAKLNPSVILVPTGAVMSFAMNSAPNGWLACDGAQYAKTGSYAALFAVIGTVYGETNGSGGAGTTHFRVPDLRGHFVRGFGADGSITSGNFGAKQSAAMLNHTHSGTTGNESQGHTHSVSATTGTESADHAHYVSGTTGDDYPDHTHFAMRNFGGSSFGVATGDNDNAANSGGASNRHVHNFAAWTGGRSAAHTHSFTTTSGPVSQNHTHNITTGNPSAGGGDETRPANIALLYCIKY